MGSIFQADSPKTGMSGTSKTTTKTTTPTTSKTTTSKTTTPTTSKTTTTKTTSVSQADTPKTGMSGTNKTTTTTKTTTTPTSTAKTGTSTTSNKTTSTNSSTTSNTKSSGGTSTSSGSSGTKTSYTSATPTTTWTNLSNNYNTAKAVDSLANLIKYGNGSAQADAVELANDAAIKSGVAQQNVQEAIKKYATISAEPSKTGNAQADAVEAANDAAIISGKATPVSASGTGVAQNDNVEKMNNQALKAGEGYFYSTDPFQTDYYVNTVYPNYINGVYAQTATPTAEAPASAAPEVPEETIVTKEPTRNAEISKDENELTQEDLIAYLESLLTGDPTTDQNVEALIRAITMPEALAYAQEYYNPIYNKYLQNTMDNITTQALKSGFYGQLPTEALRAQAAASAEAERATAINDLARQIFGEDRDYALDLLNQSLKEKELNIDTALSLYNLLGNIANGSGTSTGGGTTSKGTGISSTGSTTGNLLNTQNNLAQTASTGALKGNLSVSNPDGLGGMSGANTYNQLVSDIQTLLSEGKSTQDVNAVISSALNKGNITYDQASALRSKYVGSGR